MRIAVLLLLVTAACGPAPRSRAPWPPADGEPIGFTDVPENPRTGPHVVRRLLAEAHAMVESDQALARELPDPRGQARARQEADQLAFDLAQVEAPYPTDSADLDAFVEKLARITSSATQLHESLRIATSRISALSTATDGP